MKPIFCDFGNVNVLIADLEKVTAFHNDGYKGTLYINDMEVGKYYNYGGENDCYITLTNVEGFPLYKKLEKELHEFTRDGFRFAGSVEDFIHDSVRVQFEIEQNED